MAIWVSAATPGQPLLGPFLLSIAAGVVVAGAIAAIDVTIYVLTGRRRVKSFVGIGESNRIVVYVSRLSIDPFNSKDLEGVPSSYRGPGAGRKHRHLG
ncbi:MAG TPA: hypothetical protein VN886_04680 [Acidimicrobiales bacterium]|nr:hypothetical protein [Acidimicrobiales bacterium]